MPVFVSVGNVIVDLVMQVPALPEPGGDVIATGSQILVGGGLNTMVAAGRDGAQVRYAGMHGIGTFGDLVRDTLRQNNIQVVQAPFEGLDTGHCFAIVDASGERTFVTHVGAEGQLTAEKLAAVDVVPGDTLFVSGYGLVHPVNARALTTWIPSVPDGVRVAADVGPLADAIDPDVLRVILDRADVLTANRREALLIAPGAELDRATADFADRWNLLAVVRDGAAGCWVAPPGQEATQVEGFSVKALDTNGAGDAHDGVLLTALDHGLDPVRAARRANAAAAIAVTRTGPATAPTTAEIDAFLSDRRRGIGEP
ncbi:carbohydrate kinase family protein [Kineosporia mesophila]|uniref:Carbohydrate kinase family protein n=1 Tax=Kineosporia mesophila TaxID=566012 RepID=A0ABP6ZP88_9ACTN|nr:PfkB family carbohydrate kinase [Kineosporia mesophila]MCD5355118.1 PfkB family carbohydrate kinase [Kineosporia mesophila]